MNTRSRVVGIGSSNGDDQAAWHVVDRLNRQRGICCETVSLSETSRLLDHLQCRRLIIVDACQSGGAPGTVTRLEWPDGRIASRHTNSTHGLTIKDVLHLAEQLQRLPEEVVIFGIDVQQCQPGASTSPAVHGALEQLVSHVIAEVQRG